MTDQRVETVCSFCHFVHYFLGPKADATYAAISQGWEFRSLKENVRTDLHGERFTLKEVALCPRCRSMVKLLYVNDKPNEKKLVALKPDEASPRVFLEELLQNVESFKSLFVVIQYQDESMDCDWSKMATTEVAMACVVAQMQAQDCIRDRSKH